MNVKTELLATRGVTDAMQLNEVELDPFAIKAIMINEVVPVDPSQDFYGKPGADYSKSALSLFKNAGAKAESTYDLLREGVYLTNAVKTPKTDYAIEKSTIETSVPYLEAEIALFPNLQVIMLMGDVARKAFNMISKKETKKNAVPSISTYKLRRSEIRYNNVRIMPSYIMTGGNLLIEKSKVAMVTEDIAAMLSIVAR